MAVLTAGVRNADVVSLTPLKMVKLRAGAYLELLALIPPLPLRELAAMAGLSRDTTSRAHLHPAAGARHGERRSVGDADRQSGVIAQAGPAGLRGAGP